MSNAYHNVFGYLIPALIGIVGANMQGTNERLLETHTTNVWSFLITTAIYCYAHLAHQENSSQSWALVARVSGSVSAVSLASTFVPRSDIGHIILYTAWLCSSIIIVVHQYGARFTEACRQLYNETLKPFCSQLYNETLKPFCINICSRFQSNDTSSAGQQRPTLPV
ncbi:hypothetical protein WN943_006058 [Citrus x changshan-huyou]